MRSRMALGAEVWLILAALITVYIGAGRACMRVSYHPVTILSTLPSAGVGARLRSSSPATISTSSLSRHHPVARFGIVNKNAIMMIDFGLEAERNEGTP